MHIYMRIRYIKINNNHWKLLSFLYSNVFILNIINIYVMFAMDTCDESFVIIKEISYDLPWVVLSWKEYCMNVYVKTKRTFDIGTICWNLYYNCLNYFFWKRKKKKCWFRHYVIVFDIHSLWYHILKLMGWHSNMLLPSPMEICCKTSLCSQYQVV